MEESAPRPFVSPVLIVGAGPAGMVLAALLHNVGVSCQLVERYPTRRALPKAHVINSVTLEICRLAGFDVQAMIQRASDANDDHFASFRDRLLGDEIGALPFERQDPGWVAHRRINLAQPLFEEILERRVRTLNDVNWVVGEWESAEVTADQCISRVQTVEGPRFFASRLIVGADGANSTVREWAGIEMLGAPGQHVVSVHFKADLFHDLGRRAAIYWILDPEVSGGFIAHDSDGSWVYNFSPENAIVPTLQQARAKVQKAIGRDDVEIDVIAVSPWMRGAQVADKFTLGPIMLIGDAAHRLPPTGGLGLNTGVQDAANLAWKIAATEQRWGTTSILETYEEERRPIATINTSQSAINAQTIRDLYHRMGEAIAAGSLERLADIEVAHLIDAQWEGHNSPGLQLGYQYGAPDATNPEVGRYRPSGAVGRRVPHVELRDSARSVPVHDLFATDRFTLLTLSPDQDWVLVANESKIPVVVVSIDATRVLDQSWFEVMRLAGKAAILIRPDGHVAAYAKGPSIEDRHRLISAMDAYCNKGILFGH